MLGRLFGSIPEPGSAYEELISQMAHAEGGFIWSEDEARALVDAVLNEAAEKIRCTDAPPGRKDTFDMGAVWASELIRPAGEPVQTTETVPLDESPAMKGALAWAEELDALKEMTE
jgi:hypothetical protein